MQGQSLLARFWPVPLESVAFRALFAKVPELPKSHIFLNRDEKTAQKSKVVEKSTLYIWGVFRAFIFS